MSVNIGVKGVSVSQTEPLCS